MDHATYGYVRTVRIAVSSVDSGGDSTYFRTRYGVHTYKDRLERRNCARKAKISYTIHLKVGSRYEQSKLGLMSQTSDTPLKRQTRQWACRELEMGCCCLEVSHNYKTDERSSSSPSRHGVCTLLQARACQRLENT